MTRVRYDEVAPSYDRRYDERRYDGAHRALLRSAGDTPCDVVEVGCGTGHWLSVLAHAGHRLVGVDASRGMLARARAAQAPVHLVCGDATALPLGDASADVVACVNAFHHFEDKRRAIAETWRVLRPGGRFLSVGMDPHAGLGRWVVYDYFEGTRAEDERRFPPTAALRAWLTEAGFVAATTEAVERIDERVGGSAILSSPFLQKNGTSQLALLSDAAYAAGIARIEEEIRAAAARGEEATFAAEFTFFATQARKPTPAL